MIYEIEQIIFVYLEKLQFDKSSIFKCATELNKFSEKEVATYITFLAGNMSEALLTTEFESEDIENHIAGNVIQSIEFLRNVMVVLDYQKSKAN